MISTTERLRGVEWDGPMLAPLGSDSAENQAEDLLGPRVLVPTAVGPLKKLGVVRMQSPRGLR